MVLSRSALIPVLCLGSAISSLAQTEMAALHRALVWQRTSPTAQQPDGPVLYQLLFSGSGAPGTVPVFDTNPRHLVNSPIIVGGGNVAVGGLSVSGSTGIIIFAGGQTFPGMGTVNSVSAGAGLAGGPITSSGTLSLDTSFTNNLYPQLAAANTFATGTQAIQTGAAGTVGLAVQGASAQTANLQEWRSNAGTAVASVSTTGVLSGDGSGLTNLSAGQLIDGGINRQQIALLKPYAANQTASFAIGGNPYAMAFDGASIWVTNQGSSNVSKLRASDGTVLGTFAVGALPAGVAFDGANIWVANAGSNTVSKLRATDGALLGTFAVGNGPIGVAFDGANIWVTNLSDNTVSKLRASDGALLGTFGVGTRPIGVAFDGANIWVANVNSNTVSKLRASDGALLGAFAGTGPVAVAFDGANIWVANAGPSINGGTVSKLRASDGTLLGSFAVGFGPIGVAFDGTNIWVTNRNSHTVSKLRASDGTVLGNFPVGIDPFGVAFDGANIWVANFNSNTVSKL